MYIWRQKSIRSGIPPQQWNLSTVGVGSENKNWESPGNNLLITSLPEKTGRLPPRITLQSHACPHCGTTLKQKPAVGRISRPAGRSGDQHLVPTIRRKQFGRQRGMCPASCGEAGAPLRKEEKGTAKRQHTNLRLNRRRFPRPAIFISVYILLVCGLIRSLRRNRKGDRLLPLQIVSVTGCILRIPSGQRIAKPGKVGRKFSARTPCRDEDMNGQETTLPNRSHSPDIPPKRGRPFRPPVRYLQSSAQRTYFCTVRISACGQNGGTLAVTACGIPR